jgi:hypothetical protein
MAKVPVHEIRKLMLPLETAVDAVLDLDAERGGLLAFGTIVDARIESDPQPGLSISAQRRGAGGTERRTFELPLLAAAFIRYCWKCRIPLPRSGVKRIEAGPEGFVFTIEGTIEVVRRHGAVPKHGLASMEDASSAPPASVQVDPPAAPQPAQAAEPNPEVEPVLEQEEAEVALAS